MIKITKRLRPMGEVYRAHDARLERDVALKVLPAEHFSDPSARGRLLREARSAARLNHPHICTVYDVGEAAGQVYIAMELVEGDGATSQRELCRDRVVEPPAPVPPPEAPVQPATLKPLAPERYHVQFTASAELHDKLERLQALMRSLVPGGDLATVIEVAVTEKLERLEARRFGKSKAPRYKAEQDYGKDVMERYRRRPDRVLERAPGYGCLTQAVSGFSDVPPSAGVVVWPPRHQANHRANKARTRGVSFVRL